MRAKRNFTDVPQKPVREVITEQIALRLGRRLRKEAGLGMWRTDHRPVHNLTVPKTRGRRGTMDERAEYFDRARRQQARGSGRSAPSQR